jgi:hypothetical protein
VSSYAWLHLLHLLGAIGFIGTVFYEVVILAKVKPLLEPSSVGALERALGARTLQCCMAWCCWCMAQVLAWLGSTGRR